MPTLLARKSDTPSVSSNTPTPSIPVADNFISSSSTIESSSSNTDWSPNQYSTTDVNNESSWRNSSSSTLDSPSSNSNTGNGQSGPILNLTTAGDNAATGAQVLVANDNTDWINKKWRPAMGWTYMITCICDFVIFPILWSILQALSKGQVTSQWQPVTLMGAGLYHVSMGAILGVTAFMRSKEKIEGKAS